MKKALFWILPWVFVAGCSTATDDTEVPLIQDKETGRWYQTEQVAEGKVLFVSYCSGCHGVDASATADWKTMDINGNYPPPPLNGTAHAWHHPIAVLNQVIEEGGVAMGGQMPSFAGQFTPKQKLTLIASFQSYWSDKVYDTWLIRERASR